MSETLREWIDRCHEQNVRCPVCGARPNADCARLHLPYAIEQAERMRAEAEAYAAEMYQFARMWIVRPKEIES